MQALEFRTYECQDQKDVIALWQRAGLTKPHNDPQRDIRFAMEGPSSTILLGCVTGKIVAAVMVGHDGHRGTVYYLGVDPKAQNAGFGGQMLAKAEDWLRARGVWKLNLLIRAGNAQVCDFYRKNGYAVEERIAMAKVIKTS